MNGPDELVSGAGVLVQNVDDSCSGQHDVEHGGRVALLQDHAPRLVAINTRGGQSEKQPNTIVSSHGSKFTYIASPYPPTLGEDRTF